MPTPRLLAPLVVAAALSAVAAPPASAETTLKKAMWGPATFGGASQFPVYQELGVGLYQRTLHWDRVAPSRRPRNPTSPSDPAYAWPASLDRMVRESGTHGIEMVIQVVGAPSWSNGGRSWQYAPRRLDDFADFLAAASERYPTVRHWMIWGEPSRRTTWRPFVSERRGRPLTRRQAAAPRRYARLLDAGYEALKAASPRNIVIGGNTFTTGDISPRNWIRNLRLPNGRPPRLDLYGHNPFSNRPPDLDQRPLGFGFADFADLDLLARWVDRYLGRGRHPRLFLSEYFLPTDHFNHEFNFYVTREAQAQWVRDALRITREWSRIYTFGWFGLYDDRARSDGREVARGLLERDGDRKPAYAAFRDG